MDPQTYRSFLENFVSNNKGTTLSEVNLISLICPLSVLLLALLNSKLVRPPTANHPEIHIDEEDDEITFRKSEKPSKKESRTTTWPWTTTSFLFEFVLLALPLWIVFTNILSSVLTVGIMAITIVIVIFSLNENTSSIYNHVLGQEKLTFLSNYRASMLLVTSICILGVDFQVFPRRFAKTEELGFGVMDIGVGSFVFSAGIVAPLTIPKWKNHLNRSFILICLGLLKYVSTKLVDYHNHVSEYGIHWNFFFTMGIVQSLCGSLTSRLDRKNIMLLAILLGIGHEMILQKFHYHWIFKFTTEQRFASTIWMANIEGNISLLGFSSLYLMGSILRMDINGIIQNQDNLKSSAIKVVFLWCVFYILINEKLLVPPSRRLCNLSYIIWMIVYNLSLIVSYAGIQYYTGEKDPPKIYKCVAKNAMWFFLLANLMTGMVNLSFQSALATDLTARMILIVYILVLCVTFNVKEKLHT